MGLSCGSGSSFRDHDPTQLIFYGGQGSLTQAVGRMPLVPILSPGSDWSTTVFTQGQEDREDATVEEDHDDPPRGQL
jgi:hypothetical protein